MSLLKNKTALVTGGHRRIGKAIALELARNGANIVVFFNRDKEAANMAVDEMKAMGVHASAHALDFSDQAHFEKKALALTRSVGPIDILVNNASVFNYEPLGKTTLESWDHTFAVNLRAPFYLSKILGSAMKDKGEGHIINIIDCFEERPYSDYFAYSVSKAGLKTLTQCLAKALAPEVRVNAIHPGWMLSPEGDNHPHFEKAVQDKVPLKKMGSAQDVAILIRFLVSESQYTTGSSLFVDGGRHISN